MLNKSLLVQKIVISLLVYIFAFSAQLMLRSIHENVLHSHHINLLCITLNIENYISRTILRLEKRINHHMPASIHKGKFHNFDRYINISRSVYIVRFVLPWWYVFSFKPFAFRLSLESIRDYIYVKYLQLFLCKQK